MAENQERRLARHETESHRKGEAVRVCSSYQCVWPIAWRAAHLSPGPSRDAPHASTGSGRFSFPKKSTRPVSILLHRMSRRQNIKNTNSLCWPISVQGSDKSWSVPPATAASSSFLQAWWPKRHKQWRVLTGGSWNWPKSKLFFSNNKTAYHDYYWRCTNEIRQRL